MARTCILGHLQCGGSSSPFDRALCSMFGATVVELIAAGDFGKMVAFIGPHVGAVPIQDAVGKLKTVTLASGLVRTAGSLGICLGFRSRAAFWALSFLALEISDVRW